jgi:UDP-glucose 4-epimerase
VSPTIGSDWRDVRVLVTGARGFIGSHLCQRLVTSGAIVQALSSRSNFEGLSPDVTWSAVDLTDFNAVRETIRQSAPEVVFHLAGHVTGSQAIGDVVPTFSKNLASTVNLLTSTTEVGECRVVLAGSMHEPESDEPGAIPPSPYAASKWASSAYARMFYQLYRFPVVIARPMMVYGPAQWDVTKLLPHVITSLMSSTPPSVSSGKRTLDWVFIDDVVGGLMVLAMTPKAYGQTIDLGSGVLTSIREIVENIAAQIDASIPIVFGSLPDRPFERPRTARTEQTRQLTGWCAETSLAEGIKKTVDWWRAVTVAFLAMLLDFEWLFAWLPF